MKASLEWSRGALPTATVLLLLGSLALVGHATGWSVPTFSQVTGDAERPDDDWCKEHNVPESTCVECNISLMPKAKSVWCVTHGIYDCPLEHPEIAQLKTPAVIVKADLDRAGRALNLKPRPKNNPECKLHERRIQVASEEVMDKMGIKVRPVSVCDAPVTEAVTASGEITFEGPRVAPIFTSVSGRIALVTEKGQIGACVQRGDILAVVDSMEVGKAKAEFLHAYAQSALRSKTFATLSALWQKGALPESRYLEADTAVHEARIRLLTAQQSLVNLGLPVRAEDISGLEPEELSRRLQHLGLAQSLVEKLGYGATTANLIPVVATRDGTVTASKVVAGAMVDQSKDLFIVADTAEMWLILHVPSEEVRYLRKRDGQSGTPGQRVRFRPDGSDREIDGELVWISNTVDAKTRSVPVRVNVPNPDGKLLANTYGTGRIILREEKNAVVVPDEALHWEKDCHVVFVRDKNFLSAGAPKVFHVRTVRPGVKMGKYTEIIAGLLPGEVIATKNSALLRAELLKSSLGEGCACCR